jgi:hypothetical protein
MARRQPYQQNAPMGAPSRSNDDAAFETTEGGLEVVLNDDAEFSPHEDGQTQQSEQRNAETHLEPLPSEAKTASEPARTAEDEAYNRLKAQLERAERERHEAQNRLGLAERERSTYESSLKAERERAEQLRREHLSSQELAIENALRVAEREATAAEDSIQRALENADYQAAAKAQAALTQSYNDIARLREGKQALEAEKVRVVPQPQQSDNQFTDGGPVKQREPQSDWERIEAYITQSAHPPRVQAYMRDHYDDLFSNNGARVNKLVAAHYEAKSLGLPDFSDDYFKHVDQYMGYDRKEAAPPAQAKQAVPSQPPQAEAPAKPRASIPPAAPVSRTAPSNQATGTSITLTPAQVAFCMEAGIDPKSYARNILKLNKASADPSYTGPRWTKDMGV